MLDRLPADVQIHIFEKLSPCDLLTVASTNQRLSKNLGGAEVGHIIPVAAGFGSNIR